MDWLTFTSSVIDSVAWPLALVVAIILLREELLKAIGRIESIRHNETKIEFSNRIQEASKEAGSALPATVTPASKALARRMELANFSPRGSILESWLEVESALEDLGARYGIPANEMKDSSVRMLQVNLGDHNTLGRGVFELLQRLKETRNKAVHMEDVEIEPDAAKEYVSLANRVVTLFREA